MSERRCLYCGSVHSGAAPCTPPDQRLNVEYLPPPRPRCDCEWCVRGRAAVNRGGVARVAAEVVWRGEFR